MAQIIDGKAIAQQLRNDVKEKVAKLDKKPGLAVVQVGDNPASTVYVNSKEKACIEVGIYSEKHKLDESTTEEELLKFINKLNKNSKIHGILVQLPVPEHINTAKIIEAISPLKDVDGLHTVNAGKLFNGDEGIVPCTPRGIIKLIESTGQEINEKHAVVVGRSILVGKPVAMLLLNRNATVTICHSRTKDLAYHTKQADILIAAVGKPGMITKDMVKKGAVVIDVGTTKVNEKLMGDVDFENVKDVAGYITPVPGGVGPMTIACLLENTLMAMENQK